MINNNVTRNVFQLSFLLVPLSLLKYLSNCGHPADSIKQHMGFPMYLAYVMCNKPAYIAIIGLDSVSPHVTIH